MIGPLINTLPLQVGNDTNATNIVHDGTVMTPFLPPAGYNLSQFFPWWHVYLTLYQGPGVPASVAYAVTVTSSNASLFTVDVYYGSGMQLPRTNFRHTSSYPCHQHILCCSSLAVWHVTAH